MRTREAVKLFRNDLTDNVNIFPLSTRKRVDLLKYVIHLTETYGNEDHNYKEACCIYLEDSIRYPEVKTILKLFRRHCLARSGYGFEDIPCETWRSYSKETRQEIRKVKLEKFSQLLKKILLAEMFLLISEEWEYNDDFTRHAHSSCPQLRNFCRNISCPNYLFEEVSASYKNITKADQYVSGFKDYCNFGLFSIEEQTRIRKEKVSLFKKELKRRRLHLGEGQKFLDSWRN